MLFELSLLFKNGQWQFLFWQKIGAIFGPFFDPKCGYFRSKIRFSDIFFETTHHICLKLGQELVTIALNHRMTVMCLGKFLCWPFWSKIHCMWWELYGFGLFLVIFLQTVDVIVNFCYLNYVYGLEMIKEKLSFNKKFGLFGAIEWG